MNHEEEMKLRHDLRVAKNARDSFKLLWEESCKIMSDNKVGQYKYTETFEQRLQKKLDVACKRIEIRTDLAVNNIRTIFSEHEVMIYIFSEPNKPDKVMYLTNGILFEQLKKKKK